MSTVAARVWTCDVCGAEAVVRGSGEGTPGIWGRGPYGRPRGWWLGSAATVAGEPDRLVVLCPDHHELGEAWHAEVVRWRTARNQRACALHPQAAITYKRMFHEPMEAWELDNPRPVLRLGRGA